MKTFFCTLALLFTLGLAPLEARITHQLGLESSTLTIYVVQPENYQEEEDENIDVLYKDPEDNRRLAAFHYYEDEQFSPSDFHEVCSYTDWVYKELFKQQKRSDESLRMCKDFALRSFTSTDTTGKKTYCYMYIGILPENIAFTIISTNPESLAAAIEDYDHFAETITWQR